MCIRDVLKEFRVKNFGLTHDRPHDLLESQWEWFNKRAYAGYRVFMSVALIAWFFYDFTREWLVYYGERPYCWLLFASNWAFVAFLLYSIFFAVLCLIYNCRAVHSERVRGYAVGWFLYIISSAGIIVTTSIYWFALSNSESKLFSGPQSKVKHSLNLAILIIDFFLSGIPVRLYHVIYPVIMGVVYTLFTVFYYIGGGQGAIKGLPYIYPDINWKLPSPSTIACVSALLSIVLVQIILFVLYLIRIAISRAAGGRAVKSEEDDIDGEKASILKSNEENYEAVAHE